MIFLALLADQQPRELYRHVGELLRRGLAQQRSVWRAVLPHAIANRLAARALDDIPYDLIDQQLVTGGTDRLARSFARRLAFLHEHPRAIAIVERWLATGSILGDVAALNELGRVMFENVAPVSPEATLATLERVGSGDPAVAVACWRRHRFLLRSLAYDPSLFERSTSLLARVATQSTDERAAKEASDTFVSLFGLYLSGTHATIEQRLGVIGQLLRASEQKARSLGLAALDEVLEARHFGSTHRFEFGARSRDYGYRPRSAADVARWYGGALELLERLVITEGLLTHELRHLAAQNFRALWTSAQMYDELESLSRRFAADGFWREGWVACRQTMKLDRDRLTPDGSSRLAALELELRPSNLPERVKAIVLGDRSGGLDLDDMDFDSDRITAFERNEAIACELGAAVATNLTVFADLLPDLLRGGNRAWAFGRGLAGASEDRHAIWARLVEGLGQLPPEQRNVQVLRGFLAELWARDRDLAQLFLDAALEQSALLAFVPVLHSAVELDERGVERLKQALNSGHVPVWTYRNLAFGRVTDQLAGGDLRDLLLLIADQSDGFDVALEILSMRLYSDRAAQREHEPELLEAGRTLLRHVRFVKSNDRNNHNIADVVRTCLIGPKSGSIAAYVAGRFKRAVNAYKTYTFDNVDLLTALLTVQPLAVLDALFEGDEREQQAGVAVFDHEHGHRPNPADAIACEELIAWCEHDRETRYPLAASIVTLAQRAEETGPQVWSEQARALLSYAPDPQSVLAVFIQRFRPMSWSGSRAALLEANARLLDSLEFEGLPGLMSFVAVAKEQLAQEVVSERRRETERDRERDERFE